MIREAMDMIDEGKKSLKALLRERAYEEVAKKLESEGIDVERISDEDMEMLVKAKADDTYNVIRGAAYGTAFSIAFSMLFGV
jgi:hypothetical protein